MDKPELIKCEHCMEPIAANDKITMLVDNGWYHSECIDVFPSEYFAMADGDPLGEVEGEPDQEAWHVLMEGQFLEGEE